MADIEFEIEGLEDMQKTLEEFKETFNSEKQKELLRLGYMLEGKIKPLIPVDTSRLRNSLNTQLINSDSVETGTNVEYAEAVNDGHMIEQRFLPAKYLDTPSGRTYLKDGNKKGIMLHPQFKLGVHFMERGFSEFEPLFKPEIERWMQNLLDNISLDK